MIIISNHFTLTKAAQQLPKTRFVFFFNNFNFFRSVNTTILELFVMNTEPPNSIYRGLTYRVSSGIMDSCVTNSEHSLSQMNQLTELHSSGIYGYQKDILASTESYSTGCHQSTPIHRRSHACQWTRCGVLVSLLLACLRMHISNLLAKSWPRFLGDYCTVSEPVSK